MVESNIDKSLSLISPTHHIPIPAASKTQRSYLLCLPRCHRRLHLPQTLADKQRSVDKHAVRGAIDLEVAEEHVGAEERENLVDAVIRLTVCGDVDVEGVRGERGEGVCGAAGAGAEGEDGEVACIEY